MMTLYDMRQQNSNSNKITKLAFRNRFTPAEKLSIETASSNSPAVRVILKDLDAATFIELTRRDLKEALNILVIEELLTEQRLSEILSTDIAQHEIYKE